MALILAAAVSVSFYADEGYVVSDYIQEETQSISGTLIAPTRVKIQDTIVIFSEASTELSGARTVSTGFVSESTGRHIVAPWIVVSTGMASSTSSEMLMPFGRGIYAAATDVEVPYADSGYVVDDYYVDPRVGLSGTVIAPNRVREPLMVLNVQSETDVAVTQVHTAGIASNGQSSVVAFGARIELAGVAAIGQSAVDIGGNRLFDFGYLTSGQSAVDIGPSYIRTYGALVDGQSTTIVNANYTAGFGSLTLGQSAPVVTGYVTATAGSLSEASSSVIIASRLKWETVSEPTGDWTVINDDNYPFG